MADAPMFPAMLDETTPYNDANPGRQNGDEARQPARASDLEKADIELGKKLASKRAHPAAKAAGAAGKIGDQGPLYALSCGVVICGYAAKDRRIVGSGLAMLAAIAGADLGKRGIKGLVRRTRPNVLLEEQRYEMEAGGTEEKEEQSFPSGHMAGSVAVARALSRNFPKAGAVAGVAALAIGFSRLVKGAHWPLDVAGGAVVGLAAEELTTLFLRRLLKDCPLATLEKDRDED